MAQRLKETEQNAPLYPADYDKGNTEEITFKFISLLSERILAVDQASHSKNTSSNAIIVYAANTDELIIKLYELKLDKDNAVLLNNSETSSIASGYEPGQAS